MSTQFIQQTPSMFDVPHAVAVAEPSNVRQPIIDSVFERADAAFLERYGLFLVTFGRTVVDFIAGDVTAAYERRYGKISPSQKKSLGGLYQRAIKHGTIEPTNEYRKRDQGNVAAIYRLK